MDANDMKLLGTNLADVGTEPTNIVKNCNDKSLGSDGYSYKSAEVGTDCISRQAAIDVIFSEPLYKPGMKKRDADEVVPVIYEKIKSLPSAQPEIIRCRECDWWAKQEDSLQGRCARYGMYPTGAWFCGSAERREVTT